jgi:hypothetical protein
VAQQPRLFLGVYDGGAGPVGESLEHEPMI